MQVFALISSLHNPRNIFCAVEGFPSYFLFWKIFLTTITSSFCLFRINFDYTKTKRNSETASNLGLTQDTSLMHGSGLCFKFQGCLMLLKTIFPQQWHSNLLISCSFLRSSRTRFPSVLFVLSQTTEFQRSCLFLMLQNPCWLWSLWF